MASNDASKSFEDTCQPIGYPCEPDGTYIDPCDCTRYYRCAQTYIVSQPCPLGTAYDHSVDSGSPCLLLQNVVNNEKCNLQKPWERCENEYPQANLDYLEARCRNLVTPDHQTEESDGGDMGGVIAGVILTILVIIVLVVLIAVYVRRRGNPVQRVVQTRFWKHLTGKDSNHLQEPGSSRPNLQQSLPHLRCVDISPPLEEETYAELDETAMNVSKPITEEHSGSHINDAYINERTETAQIRDKSANFTCDNTEDLSHQYSNFGVHRDAMELNHVDSGQLITNNSEYSLAQPLDKSVKSESPVDSPYFELEKEDLSDSG